MKNLFIKSFCFLFCLIGQSYFSQAQLTIVSTARNTSCNLSCGNGRIQYSYSGILANITIQPICTSTLINDSTILNLVGGSYTITATNTSGISTSQIVTIQNPIPIVLNLNYNQPIGQLGNASVNPSGGTQPYDFLWTPGSYTSNAINNLSAGTYSVSIVDANGCSTASDFILNYAVGTNDFIKSKNVFTFPNPCSTILFLSSNVDVTSYSITSISGQILMQESNIQNKKWAIHVQNLPIGFYILKVNHSTCLPIQIFR